jgi:septal ring factor EnvC (AmiA/AmiB activator)
VGLAAAAVVAAVAVVGGSAQAADLAAAGDAPAPRELATLTARASVLGEQAAAARAAVRWRLSALRRLVGAGPGVDGSARARAIDAGTRVLARELAEARTLERERDQTRAAGEALAASARAADAIGAPPDVALPVAGAVVTRFGVGPDRATGLLVTRPGVRLGAAPGAPVRAPFAGVVALVADEPEGGAVVLEDGAGWTAIVGGLARTDVARGQRLAAGAPLGAAAAGAPGAPPVISFEVWRGRHPVDPLLVARAPAGPPRGQPRAALADPARVP